METNEQSVQMEISRKIQVLTKVLTTHMDTPEKAEEAVRNILQALEGSDDTPRDVIHETLSNRLGDVRFLEEAVKLTVRAWVLVQTDTIHERVSMLQDLGMSYSKAIDTLSDWDLGFSN